MNHQHPAEKVLHFLAISGSLRAVSSNTALLRAAAMLAPSGVEITLYSSIADLPHFNPDLDGESAPPPVVNFRFRLQACDGVLISTPEYAHGVPGTLKNALDWIVGSGELMNKPVALINASLVSTHAQSSLMETLSVMMAKVSVTRGPLASNKIDQDGSVSNPETAEILRGVISELAVAASDKQELE